MAITVGTIVDVKDRADLTQQWGPSTELRHYGIVIELLEKNRALVRLRFPKNHGGKCPRCSSTYGSVNESGEIGCADGWGCGRGFGFDEREEVIPLDKLINITVQRDQEVKRELYDRIKEALEEGLPQTCHYRDHVGSPSGSMARAACPNRHARLELLDAQAMDQLLELLDELLEL